MLRKKTATYALLALYEIAVQQKPAGNRTGVRAFEIAQRHKLPKAYVAKILSQLANAGVLHSDRGPRGGFRLNRAPGDITLYDAFEAVNALTGEDRRRGMVKGIPTPVSSTMTRIQEEAADWLKELFQKTTLADLVREEARV